MKQLYREEGKVKCPACLRSIAAIRPLPKGANLLVSRHLYQEGLELTGLGLPVLNADGFCPGSMEIIQRESRSKDRG